MIQYDLQPSKEFSKKAEEGMTGSARMGNEGGIGNAEEIWGASDDDFGKNLVKRVKSSSEKRNKQTPTTKMFGDDWEVVSGKTHKPYALDENNNNNNKTQIKQSMKRLKFKKEFNGLGNALKLIPESYKVDNKEFEMTDGNETYKIRWEGNLKEGNAVVLTAADKKMVTEDIARMKTLFGYKSQDTLGLVKGNARINENKVFGDIWNKSKRLLGESEEIEGQTADKEAPFEEADVNQAAEAKKHVHMGTASTDKGTQAPKPKEGHWEDNVKGQAAEAKKHVEGSESTDKGMVAPAPKKGEWEDIKKKAPEATEHLNESEEEEDFGTHIDGSKLPNPKDNMVTEEDEFDDEESLDGIESTDDEEEDVEIEPSDDVSDEPDLGDDEAEIPAATSTNIRLLQSPSTGEYFIEKDGKNLKVDDMYLDIASNKSLGNGSKRAGMILAKMQDAVDGDDLEEGLGDFFKKAGNKILQKTGHDAGIEALLQLPRGKEIYDTYMSRDDADAWFKKNMRPITTFITNNKDTAMSGSVQTLDMHEYLKRKKSEKNPV
jgi:hypothetical protein